MSKEIFNNLYLIAIFTFISLLIGLRVTFYSTNKSLLMNLFWFCVAALIILGVLYIFQLCSRSSTLFTLLQAITVLIFVSVISFIWLNELSIIFIKEFSIHLTVIMFFILIILGVLKWYNKEIISEQKTIFLNQRPYFDKIAKDDHKKSIANKYKLNQKDAETSKLERILLKDTKIRPCSRLPPSVMPYGTRTVMKIKSDTVNINLDGQENMRPFNKNPKNRNQRSITSWISQSQNCVHDAFENMIKNDNSAKTDSRKELNEDLERNKKNAKSIFEKLKKQKSQAQQQQQETNSTLNNFGAGLTGLSFGNASTGFGGTSTANNSLAAPATGGGSAAAPNMFANALGGGSAASNSFAPAIGGGSAASNSFAPAIGGGSAASNPFATTAFGNNSAASNPFAATALGSGSAASNTVAAPAAGSGSAAPAQQ